MRATISVQHEMARVTPDLSNGYQELISLTKDQDVYTVRRGESIPLVFSHCDSDAPSSEAGTVTVTLQYAQPQVRREKIIYACHNHQSETVNPTPNPAFRVSTNYSPIEYQFDGSTNIALIAGQREDSCRITFLCSNAEAHHTADNRWDPWILVISGKWLGRRVYSAVYIRVVEPLRLVHWLAVPTRSQNRPSATRAEPVAGKATGKLTAHLRARLTTGPRRTSAGKGALLDFNPSVRPPPKPSASPPSDTEPTARSSPSSSGCETGPPSIEEISSEESSSPLPTELGFPSEEEVHRLLGDLFRATPEVSTSTNIRQTSGREWTFRDPLFPAYPTPADSGKDCKKNPEDILPSNAIQQIHPLCNLSIFQGAHLPLTSTSSTSEVLHCSTQPWPTIRGQQDLISKILQSCESTENPS